MKKNGKLQCMKQQKINFVLNSSKEALSKCEKNEHQVDAEWLMSEVTGLSRSQLSMSGETYVTEEQLQRFNVLFQRRLDGEPLQYILGEQSFYGYDFIVDKHVLIPRFETEELVEKALQWVKDEGAIKLIDMCTGSGCIGLSLLKECPDLSGILVDLSDEALQIATRNTVRLNLEDRVQLINSDLFDRVPDGEVDIIVSNPPYIVTEVIKDLEEEVKMSEPTMALDGGDDGLNFYRRIIREAKGYLRKEGLLIVEIGYDQMEQVKKIFTDEGYSYIKGFQDMSGKDRIVLAKR